MAIALRQSTASQEVPLGTFVDDTDGKTAETGLTIANTDIKIWKNGATTLANKNSGGATHISGGNYYCVLDATDTNTIGPLVIFVGVSGALAVRVECEVLAANVFDVKFGTTALATATNITAAAGCAVSSIGSNVITATSIASNAITSAKIATDAIGASQIASNAITAAKIASDAITSAKIAADAIGSSQLASTAVDEIVAGLSAAYGVTGTVTADGSETTTSFKTSLTQADDFFNDSFLLFTSGSLDGQSRKISDFANTNGVITLATALTSAPANGVSFIIVGRSE